MKLDETLFKESQNKLSFYKFIDYLDSIDNSYHAFQKVKGDKGIGYRYVLSEPLTQEQKDYLKQYSNVVINSAQHKYAPEIKYDTVILLDSVSKKVVESKCIKEDLDERKQKRIADYRKYAQLDDDTKLTKDSIDEWALKRTCRLHNCDEEKMREELTESVLKEETIEDAAKKASSDIKNDNVVEKKGQIESVMDWALDYNQEQHELGKKNFQNVLLIGEAGTGKTSIIRQWAKENNVNLFEVRAAGMDDTDLGGAISKGEGEYSGVVQRLASTEFDKLNRPNSVLFLDEYNRAPKSVRTNLLELVNSHVVPDPRTESGQRYLENFLFTVAAINPANPDYDTDEMDMAEKTRFRNIDVVPDPKNLLKYLTKEFQNQADKASTPQRKTRALGRLNLAKALLTSKEFDFDNRADIEKSKEEGNGLALNYRTLTNLLTGSDGTKEDFLAKWNEYANSLKKKSVERILINYKDIDDKANAALKDGTESTIFGKAGSDFDRILKALDED